MLELIFLQKNDTASFLMFPLWFSRCSSQFWEIAPIFLKEKKGNATEIMNI